MKRLLTVSIALLFLVGAGCNAVTPEQLADSEAKIDLKLSQTTADLDRKIVDIDQKYAGMLTLDQKVESGLKKIDANVKLLENANDIIIQLLQGHRNVLREQLKSIEDRLEAFQDDTSKQ